MTNWEAIGAIMMVIAACIYAIGWAAYRAGGSSSRAQIAELRALVKLWQGRAERAQAGKHRRAEPLQVRAKTASSAPWAPTMTVIRMPQPVTDPGPATIAMGAVTTGGMRALTDDYIAQIEAEGTEYRKGLTAS